MSKKLLSFKSLERFLIITILIFSIILGSSVAFIISSLDSLDDINKLEKFKNKIPTKVYDVHGKLFAEFFYQKRELITFNQIPKNLINALIAMEDNNFYSHSGLDLWGMFRALVVDIFAGRIKQGGSTITQQLAKRLFTASEKTITRKIKELWYAIQIEKRYSKNEILELYFNEIYFGHGAYGIESASQIYFNKSAAEINLAECALLASLPSAPNRFSPIAFPNRSRRRHRLVLHKMVKLGYVDKKQADKAYDNFWYDYSQKNISPTLSAWNRKIDKAPYFTEYVRKQLVDIYGKEIVNENGLKVYTTLDLEKQKNARKALTEKLYQLKTNYQAHSNKYENYVRDNFVDTIDIAASIFNIPVLHQAGAYKTKYFMKSVVNSKYKPTLLTLSMFFGIDSVYKIIDNSYNLNPKGSRELKPQGAIVGIDPRNGYVVSLIGGDKFSPANRFNRATQAFRQPGSSFKPFVYLAGLISKRVTAATAIDDAPVAYLQPSGKLWVPHNYGRHYQGKITLRNALKLSINIVSVKLLDIVGYEPIAKLAASLLHIPTANIEKRFIRSHSLALGGSEVTPFELCNAFAIFGNYGKDVKPISILRVYNRDGKLLDDFLKKRDFDITGKKVENKQIIEKPAMFVGIDMMRDVVKRGTARIALDKVKLRRKLAGKTGTTSNWKDIWFAGFTPQLASTVWIGFDDPSISLGRTASSSGDAAPVVMHYIKDSLAKEPAKWYKMPRGVYRGSVCWVSGKAPSKDCGKNVHAEYFISGTGLKGKCTECTKLKESLDSKKLDIKAFKIKGVDDKKDDKKEDKKFSITGEKFNTDSLFND